MKRAARAQRTLGLLLIGAGLYLKDASDALVRAGDVLCDRVEVPPHPSHMSNREIDLAHAAAN